MKEGNIIHLNDWQTGLIPLLIKDNYSWDKLFSKTATVYTIHNIAYQGDFPEETYLKAELDPKYFETPGAIEDNGRVNFMKAGISFADAITTVSEKYAKELQTPEFSFMIITISNFIQLSMPLFIINIKNILSNFNHLMA